LIDEPEQQTVTTAVPPLYLDGTNLSLQWQPPYSVAPTVSAQDRTTNNALRFTIVCHVGTMGVDNDNVVGMTGLPANVECIDWNRGLGEIEYVGSRMRQNFTDITPYCTYIQQFMTRLLGLTLAQAQKIQCDAVNALFENKHQVPYRYVVAAGDFMWEADDSTVAAMSVATVPSIISTVTSPVTTSDADVVGKINNIADQVNSNVVTPGNTLETQINNGIAGPANSNMSALSSGCQSTGLGGSPPQVAAPGLTGALYNIQSVTPGTFINIGHVGVTSATTTPTMSPIAWTPMGATASVNLSSAEMSGLMSGISTRRTNLLNTKNSKINAINALTTISAVIAYDVTAGWPAV
jgi:hypothetical protein